MKRGKKIPIYQIDPDEILLDARNLPLFNTQQFEGRIERPISKNFYYGLAIGCVLVALLLLGKVIDLQVVQGKELATRSANNTLHQIPVFADRGLLTDRNGVELAWNTPARSYIDQPGFGHLLGYISLPTQAELAAHNYSPDELVGRDGAEKVFNTELQGQSGIKIEEVDATGKTQSDYILRPPQTGKDLALSVDSGLQTQLYQAIDELVKEGRFDAGAGVIMDIKTGELLAMTSDPEYDPTVLSRGDDREKITNYLNDKKQLFLNRAIDGLYTPGSIVKPIMALGALQEGVITPGTQIVSTGSISLPNPYDPAHPSVFKDWRVNGLMDLRQAIAVSSDVYFYEIGGGYQSQRGIGIANIDKYSLLFGLGGPTGINFLSEPTGVIPTPDWKTKVFNGEQWRIGDTYHTVIGQYGFQVTPLQMARVDAAIASSGRLVTPTVLKVATNTPVTSSQIAAIDPGYDQVVREGMRLSVQTGVAAAANIPSLAVAAKTGTAELGVSKNHINSWITGFFPYDNPRYSFAVVMERGLRDSQLGAAHVMNQVLNWIVAHRPEYTQ